nr:transposase [Paenibacillus sp. Leaf72]
MFSVTSLKVLSRCLEGYVEDLVGEIQIHAGKSHSKRWVEEKAKRLMTVLFSRNEQPKSRSQTFILHGMIPLLLSFAEQLSELEKQMNQMAARLPEVELVKSIPGIGDKLAAALVDEIGDVRQFENPKQLVAFAGLDPGIFSSGKFTATVFTDYNAWFYEATSCFIFSSTMWYSRKQQL